MSFLRKGLLIIALLVMPIAILALPAGSYKQSCTACHMYNGTLFCKCPRANGTWNATHYDNAYSRCSSIVNSNGNLVCSRSPRPGPTYGLPAGNYRSTCFSCRMRNNGTLVCRCRTRSGGNRYTTLAGAHRCRYVQNFNGVLRCTSRGSRVLPAGTYRSSCRSCRYNGSVLRCVCRTRAGTWRTSVLGGLSRCRSIANRNGSLTCVTASRALPAGSYRSSCRSCTYNGSLLRCVCRTRNGAWRNTRLPAAYRCRGGISNRNGNLTCTTRSALPGGSYRSSCTGCYSNGAYLRCRACRRLDGRTVSAYLGNIRGCRDIMNINGLLICRPF